MKRFIVGFFSFLSFFQFFLAAVLLSTVVLPISRLLFGKRPGFREKVTEILGRSYRFFIWWMRTVGLVHSPKSMTLPEGIDEDGPFVMIANHPTLIDVLLILAWFPKVSCVAKGAYYRSFAFNGLLKSTTYVPSAEEGDADTTYDRVIKHLRAGRSILMFPEGTRSNRGSLKRFRRGAIEAAFEAGVPVVPLFIGTSDAFLMKGQPFWQVPRNGGHFDVEFFDVIHPEQEVDVKSAHQRLAAQYKDRFSNVLAGRSESDTTYQLESGRKKPQNTSAAK